MDQMKKKDSPQSDDLQSADRAKDARNQPDRNRETDQRRAGQSDATDAPDDMPTLRFDEGERKPAPIEVTGSDGVRKAVMGEPAGDKGAKPRDAGTEATMPPGEGRDPKRNTM